MKPRVRCPVRSYRERTIGYVTAESFLILAIVIGVCVGGLVLMIIINAIGMTICCRYYINLLILNHVELHMRY